MLIRNTKMSMVKIILTNYQHVNIVIVEYVSMLKLALSSKPHKAVNMAVDSCSHANLVQHVVDILHHG